MTEQSIPNQEQIDHDTAIIAGAVLKLAKIMTQSDLPLGEQLAYSATAEEDIDGFTVTFTFKRTVEQPVGLYLPQGV